MNKLRIQIVKRTAKEVNMNRDDTEELVKIFKEYEPEFKVGEDRSEWTEEQWKEDKKKNDKRKDMIKKEAFKAIEDKETLQEFFEKLDEHKKNFKESFEKLMKKNLQTLAKKSGLSDKEFDHFLETMNANKVKIHWRPGMHQNEKKKAFGQLKKNWESVKGKVLEGCDGEEQTVRVTIFPILEIISGHSLNSIPKSCHSLPFSFQERYKKFFSAVEEDFVKKHSGGHGRRRHQFRSEGLEGSERRHGR